MIIWQCVILATCYCLLFNQLFDGFVWVERDLGLLIRRAQFLVVVVVVVKVAGADDWACAPCRHIAAETAHRVLYCVCNIYRTYTTLTERQCGKAKEGRHPYRAVYLCAQWMNPTFFYVLLFCSFRNSRYCMAQICLLCYWVFLSYFFCLYFRDIRCASIPRGRRF